MNARKPYRLIPAILLALAVMASARGTDPVAQAIREGNTFYADGQYTEAVNKYNEALIEQPAALEPKFNKANGYYRLDNLGEAIDLYREVAAESRDMALVAKAKYNLGNCLFQRGIRQRDSDLQKALEEVEASITYWRSVLDIEPENIKAAENIEVARLTIKDILDQIAQQQEQQEQQGEEGQEGQEDQQQQGQNEQPQQQDQPSEQEPSDSQQDSNQPQPSEDQQEPEPQQQQDDTRQQEETEEIVIPDTTAQEILDKEQRQKQQRQILQRQQIQRVERDW